MENNQATLDSTICESSTAFAKRTEKKSTKKTVLLMAIVCSVLMIIMGILTSIGLFYEKPRINFSSGSDEKVTTTSYEYYGGDAYTGMQQASADTSNNTAAVAARLQRIGQALAEVDTITSQNTQAILLATGFILIALGLGSGSYFAVKFVECIESEKSA